MRNFPSQIHQEMSNLKPKSSPDKDNRKSIPPEERVRRLADDAKIEINPGLKAIQYVRSGKEMIRMAENYKDDNEFDKAYILYMRFLT